MSIYSDFNFEFDKIITNDIETLEDYKSINQSIKNILFTNRGEVPFDPLFGSGLNNILFEKMSLVTELLIRNEINFALENHEPRIQINNIDIQADNENLQYYIDIEYIIIKLNSIGNVQITLQLQGL